MQSNYRANILWLSIPLTLLVITVSCVGILTSNFYSAETINWQAQAIGQDIFDLFVCVPVLGISAFMVYKGNKSALLVWAGTVIYLIYTFLIYCFAVRFNSLFPVYCLILGLAFYSLVYFFYTQTTQQFIIEIRKPGLIRVTGIYLIVISILFYLLWLSEIIPNVINQTVPESLKETGLVTNPVHVIDLSVILPGIFITGILLLKNKSIGILLAPVLLAFFILMDLTIAGLIVVMKQRGLEANLPVAAVMFALSLLSLIILVRFMKSDFRLPA